MNNLIYKEVKLSIPMFLWIVAFLAATLLLIPQWLYFISFMYFFWISVPQMFGIANTNNDMAFTMLMPIKRNDYVKSKIMAVVILGLAQILFGVIFALINHALYHQANYALDLNLAFFGLIFFMYGIFNLIFFSMYFKTGYNYGLPSIVSNIVVLGLATGFELINIFYPKVTNILEGSSGSSRAWQLAILFAGISLFVLFNYLAYLISARKFKGVDL